MNRMQHTRPCASCGKLLYNVGNRCKYCPECSRNRHNASNRKWRASGTRTEQRHRALWRRPQKAAMTRCWQMSGPQNRPG